MFKAVDIQFAKAWTLHLMSGISVERGVRQTNKQDNQKACRLAPSHPNLRDKDIAEIDAPRQKHFHVTPPPPAQNASILLCTEIKWHASNLVTKTTTKLTNKPGSKSRIGKGTAKNNEWYRTKVETLKA